MRAPSYMHSKVGRFIWDSVFSCIGFPRVKVTAYDSKKDNRTIYLLEFKVFWGTTHYAFITPFFATTLGNFMYMMQQHGMVRTVGMDTPVGVLYVPKWAWRDVLYEFAVICRKHDTQLKFLREEMLRLSEQSMKEEAVIPTTADIIAAGKEPTLH